MGFLPFGTAVDNCSENLPGSVFVVRVHCPSNWASTNQDYRGVAFARASIEGKGERRSGALINASPAGEYRSIVRVNLHRFRLGDGPGEYRFSGFSGIRVPRREDNRFRNVIWGDWLDGNGCGLWVDWYLRLNDHGCVLHIGW